MVWPGRMTHHEDALAWSLSWATAAATDPFSSAAEWVVSMMVINLR